MEVIERGAGPEPPLWADSLSKPPLTLEGGPCGKGWESHREAVILVLGLLLVCKLEGHRVGSGPDSLASAPGYTLVDGGAVWNPPSGLLSNPRVQSSSKLIFYRPSETQLLMPQPCSHSAIPPSRC